MKILFDFRSYQAYQYRGVGRYVYDVFTRAIMFREEKSFVLVDDKREFPVFNSQIMDKIIFCFEQEFSGGKYKTGEFDYFVNGTACLLGTDGYNGVETLYPSAVLDCCRHTACILHDFIPLFYQQYIPRKVDKVNFAMQTEMLRKIDHIFTNSMFTLYSGVRYLKRPEKDFTCLYGGADEKKFSTENSNKEYDVSLRKNHLVYISGDAPQKNSEGIVQAFCKAYRKGNIPSDAKLYIVCKASEGFISNIKNITMANKCVYGRQVEATGFIRDDKMIDLLASARSSIYPSFYEGLGLPILESYMAGTPCWASNVSATQEFVLPECSFDPFDEDSMIDAIEEIYTQTEMCVRSLEFGRKLIKEINWENSAKRMLMVLEGDHAER